MSRHLSQSECFRAISNAELYSVFSDLGYAQFQFSHVNRYFRGIQSLNSAAGREAYQAIAISNEASKGTEGGSAANEQTGPGATGAQLNEWGVYTSAYIRSTKAYKQHEDRPHADAFLKIFDYFENPANYAATKPRVTYCYMEATHVPFVFDEFGGILPHSQIRNWRDEEIYLGQYKYITKHMTAIISTIIENDPESIIIVMSDHGIRYHADCTRKHAFYITDKDSCRIMNAVYIKGDRYDIEGLSGINTLRYILGFYDLKDYPPIKDPITSDSPDRLAGIIPKPR
jgi:hypothetical protein